MLNKASLLNASIAAALPVLLFCLLFGIYIAPSGSRGAVWSPGTPSPFIGRPLPDARVNAACTDERGACTEVIDEPLYMSVAPPPGTWTGMRVEVEFDPGDQDLLEVGLLKDIRFQNFSFAPLAFTSLEKLEWPSVEKTLDSGSVLRVWDKSGKTVSLSDFFNRLPARDKIAVYRTAWEQPFRDPNVNSLGRARTYTTPLRGPHEAIMYVQDDEAVEFSTSFVDVNRAFGPDEGFIKIINEAGETIFEKTFADDGNATEDQTPSETRKVEFRTGSLPEGVYRITLSSTSDIVWRSITESGRYFVLRNIAFIADDVGYLDAPRASTVWTDAKYLSFTTAHAEGVQTLKVGSSRVAVSAAGQKVNYPVEEGGVLAVQTPVGDVKMTGDGKFALSADAFFNPDAVNATALPSIQESGVSYVLATTAPVAFLNSGWRTASASFALENTPMENGAYKIAFSAPHVTEVESKPRIHRVHITFSGQKLSGATLYASIRHFIKGMLFL